MWSFDISADVFFAEYWQKRPVVMRKALSSFNDPISPEELAGLSLLDEVESRVVQYSRSENRWSLEQGPFCSSFFSQLPDEDWTLLVQNVDAWDESVRGMLAYFYPIPGWRLDDIMVSYATAGGGVGPHVDQYDVFLIQGKGQRRWQVGTPNQRVATAHPHPLLKHVGDFEAVFDITTEAGDVLYLPPNTPHNGTALCECLTYSVGFRAPSQHAVLEQLLLNLLEKPEFDSQRYTDDLGTQFNKQTLPTGMNQWLNDIKKQISRAELENAFGQLVTRRKDDTSEMTSVASLSNQDFINALKRGSRLTIQLAPDARVMYETHDKGLTLWINGERVVFQKSLSNIIVELCEARQVSIHSEYDQQQIVDFNKNLAYLVEMGWVLIKS